MEQILYRRDEEVKGRAVTTIELCCKHGVLPAGSPDDIGLCHLPIYLGHCSAIAISTVSQALESLDYCLVKFKLLFCTS